MAPMFSDGGSSLALAPVGCAFWPMIARSPAGAALQHTTLLRQPSVNKRLCAATHPDRMLPAALPKQAFVRHTAAPDAGQVFGRTSAQQSLPARPVTHRHHLQYAQQQPVLFLCSFRSLSTPTHTTHNPLAAISNLKQIQSVLNTTYLTLAPRVVATVGACADQACSACRRGRAAGRCDPAQQRRPVSIEVHGLVYALGYCFAPAHSRPACQGE